MKDLRQTREYSQFLEQIGWIPLNVDKQFFYIKKIPIFGSAIKLQRTNKIPFNTLNKLAKRYRAFQIIVEPNKNVSSLKLLENGYKISNTPYLPTKTLQIDITKTKQEIINQMKKDGRYSLRKSQKQLVVEERDIEKFRAEWKAVVGNKRHVLPINELLAFKNAFGGDMILIQSKKGDAGGMFIKTKDIAYYWIGYTSDTARETLVQYKIIWRGIVWAKKRGAKLFDFEGIYDERFPIKGWQGFSHFKKSFGGKEVTYPGSFTKWRLPI